MNPQTIEQYGEAYAKKITDNFFHHRDTISGPEILSLTPVRQVNLFILRELMNAWKQEISRFKSPYFDYQHPEMISALTSFQNTLSNHISVTSRFFAPLAYTAVVRTLGLIFEPLGFYGTLVSAKPELTLKSIQAELAYVKINRKPLILLIDYFADHKIGMLPAEEAGKILVQLIKTSGFVADSPHAHEKLFSETVPFSVDALYSPSKMSSMPSAFEEIIPKGEDAGKVTALKKDPSKDTHTLADKLASKNRGFLRESLTINQKFMFTKILFFGDFEVFASVIKKVDQCKSMDEIMTYLEKRFPDWDKSGEEYQEFISTIKQRFR